MQLIPTTKYDEPTVIQCPSYNKNVSQLNEFTKIVWEEKEKHRKKQRGLFEMYDEMQKKFVEEKIKSRQLETKLQEIKCKKSCLTKVITDLIEVEVVCQLKHNNNI